MERLTEKVFGFVKLKACGNDLCKETCAEHDEENSCKNCHIQKAFEKLEEYEDLEEQGFLLRLPCKVGDTIYELYRDGEYCVSWWDIKEVGFSLSYYERYKDKFGKSVFLTKEEAEQKLKEMDGD